MRPTVYLSGPRVGCVVLIAYPKSFVVGVRATGSCEVSSRCSIRLWIGQLGGDFWELGQEIVLRVSLEALADGTPGVRTGTIVRFGLPCMLGVLRALPRLYLA